MDKLALTKPSTSVLSRSGVSVSSSLSPFQGQVDQLVEDFVDQATEWKSLASMMVGGLAYRVGKIGILNLRVGASANVLWRTPLRAASVTIGLGSEVMAFELTNRLLHALRATGQSPLQGKNFNPWSWSGPQGLKQGFLSSAITFGALKGLGRLAQGHNPILQHLFQDSGMVLGHQLSSLAGIGTKPEGTMAEQFLHAEATNLQLGAGMALGHAVTGGRLQALERGLDLSLHSNWAQLRAGGSPPLRIPQFTTVSLGPQISQTTETKRPFILQMSSAEKGGGGSGGKDEDKPTKPFQQISMEAKQRLIEVYQQNPDVKVILDGSGWTLEEKRDLVDLLIKRSGDLNQALMNFPTALRSLQNAGFSQDMQVGLLTILAAKARNQVHRAYQKIPLVVEALQRKYWEVEEQYRLLSVMADRSGMHADEAYEKLLPALEALEITNWSLKNKYRFMHFLAERAGSVVAPSLEGLPHTLSELKEMGWGFHQNFQFLSFLIINAGRRPPFVRDSGVRRVIHFNPLQRASRPPEELQPWREHYQARSIDEREPTQGLVIPIRSAQTFPARVEIWDVKYVDGDKLILSNGEKMGKKNLRSPLLGQRVVKNIQGTYFPLREGDRVVFWPRPKGGGLSGSWWKRLRDKLPL